MFKAGDTVRGYEGIGVITHIYEYDGVIDVNFAGDKFNTPSLPESLRRVEVFTFWDLCAVCDDAAERYPGCWSSSLWPQFVRDAIDNGNAFHRWIWEDFISVNTPLPAHLAYLYDWTEVRDVVDNAAEG
jgi:hypothetical protein